MRRSRNRRWLYWIWMLWTCCESLILEATKSTEDIAANNTEFSSPRMDYERWTPIGRGDPLKNDPTYDYVPPVLEHVHYWADSNNRKSSDPKDILILGVSSKKPSLNNHNHHHHHQNSEKINSNKHYEDGPTRYHQNHYQRQYYNPSAAHPSYISRNKPSSNNNYRFKNQVPYTVLMPPPPLTPPVITNEESVTFGPELSALDSSSVQVTWHTPLPYNPPDEYKNPNQLVKYTKGKVEDASIDTYVNINKPSKPELMQTAPHIVNLLKKEKVESPSIMSTTFLMNIPRITQTTTLRPTTLKMTTENANFLTTDPLFKHYKQPVEPMRGPMYFVIQGHSKVKTYGPAKSIFGIKIQDTNDITSNEDYFNRGSGTGGDAYRVKHLHNLGYRNKKEEATTSNRAGKSLKTLPELIRAHHGAIDSVQETEVEATFGVAEPGSAVSEVYVKGTVDDESKDEEPKDDDKNNTNNTKDKYK